MGVRVRAMMDVFYNGQDRKTGDEFDTVDDMHAKVLIISGRVEEVKDEAQPEKRGRYKRRDMRAAR